MTDRNKVEAACVPCSRDHLITVKAVLSEAARMAKNRPISDPEIQERIQAAEEELDAWERFDVSPEKIAELSPPEQEIIRNTLNQARSKIRHGLEEKGLRWGKGSVADLENAAKDADDIIKEFKEKISPYYQERRFGAIGQVQTMTDGPPTNWAIIAAIIGIPAIIIAGIAIWKGTRA